MNKDDYRKVTYRNGLSIYFQKNYAFHVHFGHTRKTRKFLYHKNLLSFLAENPEINIFFTVDYSVKPFQRFGNDFLVNIESYLEFCKSIQNKTAGRAKAFLGQHIKLANISTSLEERDEFVKTNATEKNILEALKSFDHETQKRILDEVNKASQRIEPEVQNITSRQFIEAFATFLGNSDVQSAVFNNMPKIHIETLRKHLKFLENNLDKNETFIQNWIDEEDGKYRKQRCLIFGVEYVDPKREGRINEKRFDILAEQNREYHILIELKSPKSEVFEIDSSPNENGGITTTYKISPELARGIPQILSYKKWYEDASLEETQALGIQRKKPVSKCVIVIGKNKEDDVWKDNFNRLKGSMNIEISTYTDLIDKLQNTIKNLEENL